MAAEDKLDVSIVLAAFNEQDSIEMEINLIKEAMSRTEYSYEIIVVDDASTDRTAEIAEGLAGIRLIRHARNRGSGGARKTGTRAARGDLVVWSDVDLTYPNQDIPRLIKELKDRNLDQIVGARESEKGTWKWLRVPAKLLIRWLAIWLSRTYIPDLNSGLRVFKREIALKFLYMVPDGFSCVSTITLSFLSNGYAVGYAPISYHQRVGRSKFGPFKDTYNYLLQVIRMVMYFDPLRIFLPISAMIFLLAFISGAINFFQTGGIEQSDIIIFLTAVIVAVIGLLADLIVMQAKRGH